MNKKYCKCYLCDEQIIEKVNSSDEHIIPNAFGGHLKDDTHLCMECNSKLGDKVDIYLINQLSWIASHLNIKRERGENQPIEGFVDSKGVEYSLDFDTPRLKRPLFSQVKTKKGLEIKAIYRDEREAKKNIISLTKKYPQISIEEIQSQIIRTKERIGWVGKKFVFGGKEVYPALLKIGINFFLFNSLDIVRIKDSIERLKNGKTESFAHSFTLESTYNNELKPVCHTLILFGDKITRAIYIFIDLFGCFHSVICLSKNYIGEDFQYSYRYNVVELVEQTINKLPIITKEQLLGKYIPDFSFTQQRMEAVFNCAKKIHEDHLCDELIALATRRFLNKYGDKLKMTKEMIDDYCSLLIEEFQPYFDNES